MIQAYFLSDLHLGSQKDPRFFLFRDWLKSLKSLEEVTHLFLLGDIFDLWIADYDYFINEYKELIVEISRLRDLGVEIHYFEGNHDLYLTKYWQEQLKINVHTEYHKIKLGDYVFRLEHGDQMDPEDKGYKFLRWFLRTSVMKFVAHHFPEALMVKIGMKSSEQSRKYTSTIKTMDQNKAQCVIRNYAKNISQIDCFDFIITGHTHLLDEYEFTDGEKTIKSINLGSWFDSPQLLHVSISNDQLNSSWLSLSRETGA